jgi:hypothetical protein
MIWVSLEQESQVLVADSRVYGAAAHPDLRITLNKGEGNGEKSKAAIKQEYNTVIN